MEEELLGSEEIGYPLPAFSGTHKSMADILPIPLPLFLSPNPAPCTQIAIGENLKKVKTALGAGAKAQMIRVLPTNPDLRDSYPSSPHATREKVVL